MRYSRLPSLLVAVFLQLSPLARTVQPVLAGVLQPLAILLRLGAAVSAIAGGAHAVSGGTGLQSAATVTATNGVPFSYRAQISSTQHGAAQSYSFSGLPTGITVISKVLGSLGGTPNSATLGAKKVSVTGWKNNNTTGDNYTTTFTIVIVGAPPVITKNPLTQTATEGTSVSLSVTATSADTPVYQWIKDGVEVASATNPTLVFSPVKLTDAGSYKCRVQNSGGIVVSTAGVLTVNPAPKPPQIVAPPVAATVTEGDPASFTVQASGDPTLLYQWKHDGTPIQNATSATYSIAKTTTGDAGQYTVRVSNGAGFVDSTAVALTVNPVPKPPQIVAPPVAATVTEGDPASFTVQASGDPTLLYQWKHDGTPIQNATSATYSIAKTTAGDAGQYVVRISNGAGFVDTTAVALTVNAAAKAPVIDAFVATPSSNLHAGETLTLTVNATASTAPTYEWFLGANPVAGATQSTLVVPKITGGQAGSYTVKVTANSLTATSSPIIVGVGAPLAAGAVTANSGATTVAFGAIVGRHYYLETATSLDAVSWDGVADGVASQAAGSLSHPFPADAEFRFYRVRVQ